jgi:leucine dehydrogenase
MKARESSYFEEHEMVKFFYDIETKLHAIIAVHSTALGPALGGCRFLEYNSQEEALKDVLRLSQGMTFKTAISGLPYGGGKMVVLKKKDVSTSREEIFKAVSKFINTLNGSYITGIDSGTSPGDMKIISRFTPYVVGQKDTLFETSYFTAYGTLNGIKEATKFLYGTSELSNLRIAVQGLGRTGYFLCKFLHELGAELFVTDRDINLVKKVMGEFDATSVPINDIYSIRANVFAPCALGGVINRNTINKVKADIICGTANNQLTDPSLGQMLHDKQILYVPDYVVNAGGAISLHYENEIANGGLDNTFAHIDRMNLVLKEIFEKSENMQSSTNSVADKLVIDKLSQICSFNKITAVS